MLVPALGRAAKSSALKICALLMNLGRCNGLVRAASHSPGAKRALTKACGCLGSKVDSLLLLLSAATVVAGVVDKKRRRRRSAAAALSCRCNLVVVVVVVLQLLPAVERLKAFEVVDDKFIAALFYLDIIMMMMIMMMIVFLLFDSNPNPQHKDRCRCCCFVVLG